MKTLNKTHKEQITQMIVAGEKLAYIKSYCLGAGFDVNNYSSPVCIINNKLTLRYRGINSYFILA